MNGIGSALTNESMALVSCPECKHEVSERAAVCSPVSELPKRVRRRNNGKFLMFLVASVFVAAIASSIKNWIAPQQVSSSTGQKVSPAKPDQGTTAAVEVCQSAKVNDLVNQLLATGIIMKTGPVIYVDAGWYSLPLDAKRATSSAPSDSAAASRGT